MPLPEPSFQSYYFFPLAFEKTQSGRGFQTQRTQNHNANVFDATQEGGLWSFDLGGLRIPGDFIDEWDAFQHAVKGAWKPFLFRLQSKRFEIFKDQPGGIGTGDGTQTQFQLVKSRVYTTGPATVTTEIVTKPHHWYPEMRIPTGSGQGTLVYPVEQVRIWVAGTEIQWLDGWDIDRETGIVTFDEAPADGALIQAACKFWILVHGQDSFMLEWSGGTYSFPSGAHLYQVAGEV